MAATVLPRLRRAHAPEENTEASDALAPASGQPAPRPPDLQVVRRPPSRQRQPWRRAVVLSAVFAVGSLLAVAGAQAYLIQGQVNLVRLQKNLNSQLGQHRDLELKVAQLEQPTRIVSDGQAQGLIVPGQVKDLPQVNVSPQTPSKQPAGTTASSSTP